MISTNGNIPFLKHGHVIGLGQRSYMIDDIVYSGDIAQITVTPPLRETVMFGQEISFEPCFLGTIVNGQELRQTYDAVNVGHIKPGRIVFQEANI